MPGILLSGNRKHYLHYQSIKPVLKMGVSIFVVTKIVYAVKLTQRLIEELGAKTS